MPSLEVNGYPFSYAEAGSGTPLLLIHGTLGDQRSMAPQMADLGAKYRVMALSLRHTWPGSWAEGDDFTIERHVADVAAFIRALDAGPAHLLGHSRGGHISFRVAERHPELVRALVLAEPGGELDETLGGAPASGQQAAGFKAAAQVIASGDEEGGLRMILDQIGGAGSWDKRTEAKKEIARANARTLIGQMNEQRKPYTRAAAASVRKPTLLLGGAQSGPNFGRIIDALVGAMPDTQRVTVPNATHGLNYDNPEFFNRTVLEFLAKH